MSQEQTSGKDIPLVFTLARSVLIAVIHTGIIVVLTRPKVHQMIWMNNIGRINF